jgi:hypothetical protein
MSGLWKSTDGRWELASAVRFEDEATLHSLVEEAPHLLPLSGSPQVTIVGREVTVGSGSIDLIAIEDSGRPVIIEVKLARNAEARRAVVAQALSYAAHLNGLTAQELERGTLARHLTSRGLESLVDAARSADQEGAYSLDRVSQTLNDSLASGSFRVVLILDDAPAELIRLVGYLEGISDRLSIDLITVAAYDINGSKVLVPQRIDPGRGVDEGPTRPPVSPKGDLTPGSEAFRRNIAESPAGDRAELERLCRWAESLEDEGLVGLESYRGTTGRYTLLPRLLDKHHGLVTIYNDGGPSLSVHRTVFEKRAPASIPRVEALIAPVRLGQGNTVRLVSDDLLSALTDAYREAVTTETTPPIEVETPGPPAPP